MVTRVIIDTFTALDDVPRKLRTLRAALAASPAELAAQVTPSEPSERPSVDEWRGVAGYAREAADMLDILAADEASPEMLRREAANMRALAGGIDRRHARAPDAAQVRAQHRAEALREAIDQ